ncbi:hypothetical protein HMPREF9194_00515 [Treponema maltophilum ATCC 51939]|uniref:PilZ domain-containing protein n=1 Tax=Treponema maltophilum ATCC 51939 TaxID=1125699 RepID=S3JZY2_TREMA|nr:PilZ domain-containing protein [Treponema maltophilum]EPF30201.1 hypothetical protein HMPREF9194_00515 [Treponema maltophilum ATCC 51939]
MLILQAGSAIAMRQNTKLIPIALLVLALLALLIVLRYALAALVSFYKETARKKPGRVLDVGLLKNNGKKLGLTGEEIAFLIDLCKTYKIKDLPLLAETEQCIAGPLKTLYKNICAQENSAEEAHTEEKKLRLFIIIHKIENGKRNLTMVTNSTAFPAGLPATYTDESGGNYHVVIIENTDAEMIISIPQKKDGSKVKPHPLSKISLTIQLKNGIAYRIFPRIVRYQQRKDFEEMVVTHTKNIKPMLQRRFKRVPVTLRCSFCAAKEIEDGGTKRYTVSENSYPGIISDISAGGCKLRTAIPIREGRYIQISTDIAGKRIDSIIGVVVKSKKDVDGKTTVLHMRFVRMAKKARNIIFASVYNYDDSK